MFGVDQVHESDQTIVDCSTGNSYEPSNLSASNGDGDPV
jgi:hypothetical protein